jgi:hypothetical protein
MQGKPDTSRPTVYRLPSGELFVQDGNHRLAAAALRGERNAIVDMIGANSGTGASVPLALNAMEQSAPKGFTAYHGSPHDFDKFDLSKIGTGEGAQAYGHGLYFAENEDVARNYKMPQKHVDAGSVYDVFPTEEAALTAAGPGGGAMTYRDGWVAERAEGGILKKNPGHMYEVNIKADPEQFLDWDKPLSDHPEHVRNAVMPIARQEAEQELQRRAREEARNDNHIRRMLGKEPKPRDQLPTADELALRMWGNEFGPGYEQQLREAGIPGIRYLDAGSRAAGGTSNYVLFDDSLVDINRKYANHPLGSAAPLAFNDYDDKRRPFGRLGQVR